MNGRHPSLDTVRVDRDRAEPCGHALFVVNDAGLRVVALPASGSLAVGRSADADVRVADVGMSRRHLRIHVESPFQVEDLSSANGTAVGGRWLRPGELHTFAPGDAIVAGTTTMLIRSHANCEPAGRTDGPDLEPIVSDRFRPVLALADRAAASMIHVLGLARDEAADMRARCKEGLAHWAQGGFHFQHLCALFTLAAADLYEGLAGAAAERVESAWKDIERSLLLRVQFFRLDLWALRGRAALAAAGNDASSSHVRRVERAIARIEREGMAWANGHTLALRAGLARLRGDVLLACSLLERAEQGFAAVGMAAHAAACKLQRGRLMGATGGEILEHGCALLNREGVRRPSRFAATLIPVAACS